MKTLFLLQNLWELIDKAIVDANDEARQQENRKRNTKTSCLIHYVVDESILDRIVEVAMGKEALEMIRNEYQGFAWVLSVRCQTLRQSFETLQMKDSENVQSYISRIAGKVLRSFAPRFVYVVVSIE